MKWALAAFVVLADVWPCAGITPPRLVRPLGGQRLDVLAQDYLSS
jgi:hypothetical protein